MTQFNYRMRRERHDRMVVTRSPGRLQGTLEFSIHGKPVDFYIYRHLRGDGGRTRDQSAFSGWIKGRAAVYHELANLLRQGRGQRMVELCEEVFREARDGQA